MGCIPLTLEFAYCDAHYQYIWRFTYVVTTLFFQLYLTRPLYTKLNFLLFYFLQLFNNLLFHLDTFLFVLFYILLLISASNVRCNGSKCCRGCGPQEQFYGCSDIAIKGNNSPYKPPVIVQPVPTQKLPLPPVINNGGNGLVPGSFRPIGTGSNSLPSGHVPVPDVNKDCKATALFRSNIPTADDWCRTNCENGYCPKQYCDDTCRGKVTLVPVNNAANNACKARQFWREKYSVPEAADKWCINRCGSGHCPLEYCEDSCWARLWI